MIFSASRCLFLYCFPKSRGQDCSLRQSRTKAPTSRFKPLEVYGCHPAHRRGTNRLKRADTGFLLWGCRLRRGLRLLADIILPEKPSATFHFFETFREHRFWARGLLFDYCRVVFSWVAHTESNIFEHSHFWGSASSLLLFVLLIYFLPKSWRGASARWWVEAPCTQPLPRVQMSEQITVVKKWLTSVAQSDMIGLQQ